MPVSPRQPDDLTGRTLAHYAISPKIGQGGLGNVVVDLVANG